MRLVAESVTCPLALHMIAQLAGPVPSHLFSRSSNSSKCRRSTWNRLPNWVWGSWPFQMSS